MEVFRAAYEAVGFGWLAAPTGWTGLRPMFDYGYKLFARNRLRLGGLLVPCGCGRHGGTDPGAACGVRAAGKPEEERGAACGVEVASH